ncbi:MAG TPA: hypothetical protein VK766_04615 [Cytophagaceae bacterium]|nr:hypothetical protein [Cytophagaceae bacterium]
MVTINKRIWILTAINAFILTLVIKLILDCTILLLESDATARFAAPFGYALYLALK